MNKNQNGFITMIVIMIVIAGAFVYFAINRIIDARSQARDVGGSSTVLKS